MLMTAGTLETLVSYVACVQQNTKDKKDTNQKTEPNMVPKASSTVD